MSEDTIRLHLAEATALARDACLGAGASAAVAQSLADAIVSAEASGNENVGFSHLADYLKGMREGRINGTAIPEIASPAPTMIKVDAKKGIAQFGFDLTFDDLVSRAENLGMALFSQSNSYTTGELGYYARRLADKGLVALAFTNGPALMTVPGGTQAVYCTNPFTFAAPCARGPLLIDQATSSTAFVNIRRAAGRGESIPEGWAVDATGRPTTEPMDAMKGALLTFGGARGANIALMVEVLAAGLTGANWSLDAPGFLVGTENPGSGLLVIAISPALLDDDFENRLSDQLQRLESRGVHIPGRAKAAAESRAAIDGIALSAALVSRLSAATGPGPAN